MNVSFNVFPGPENPRLFPAYVTYDAPDDGVGVPTATITLEPDTTNRSRSYTLPLADLGSLVLAFIRTQQHMQEENKKHGGDPGTTASARGSEPGQSVPVG